jgi:RNA polymerase sigma-70 factor, ECF subfamily
MNDASHDSALWVQQLIHGDEEVVREFWERYGPQLEQLAGRHIARRLQPRIGPDDVVQSVCRTFLRRSKAGNYDLTDTDGLWRLLCAITLTKVRQHVRFHLRQRRTVLREAPQPSESSVQAPIRDAAVAAGQQTPDAAAAFSEQMEQLLGSLDSEEQMLVQLRIEGFTQPEIAQSMGCSERTVRRLLTRVRAKWSRQLEESLSVDDSGQRDPG